MSSLGLFSKMKQGFRELVSDKAKTQDSPELLSRLKNMEYNEKNIKLCLQNVTMFIEASGE